MRVGFVSIFFIGLLISCVKQDHYEKLPPKSHSGKHVLGFELNGKTWTPYDRGNHKEYELPHPQFSENDGIKISATRIDEKASARNWFCIEIDSSCTKAGQYTISSTLCTSPYQTFYYGNNKELPSEIYTIDQSKPHIIHVTHLDRSKKIIAGTFEFDMIDENGKRLEVRSGRFDLKLK